jgi:hypothetical protein
VGALIEGRCHAPLGTSTQEVMDDPFELFSAVAERRDKEPEAI